MDSPLEIEEWLAARLVDDAALKAVIGTRLYPVMLPDADALPGATYQRFGTGRQKGNTGQLGTAKAQFRLAFMGAASREGYKAALKAARAARLSLNGYRGKGEPGHFVQGCWIEDEKDDPQPPLFADGNLGIVHQRVLMISLDYQEQVKENIQPPA